MSTADDSATERTEGFGKSGRVRDTFESLRRSLAPGLAKMSATWSDCKTVLWNTRNVVYVICLLTIILLVSLILSWNKTFVVFLAAALTIFSVYGALAVSKQSCFSVFDNALVNSFTNNAAEEQRERADRAEAAAARNAALRKIA